jgi:hypothetical protein
MCSDLQTRQIKWIWRADQLKNGDGRSSQFIHWGVPATVIAAQAAEVHHDEAIAALPAFSHDD